MSAELGTWLRKQREDRSWTKREMARQIIQAGQAVGDTSMPDIDGVCHNIHRWESGKGGVTERYKLYYCKAFDIPVAHFGGATAGPAPAVPVASVAMVIPQDSTEPGMMAQVPVAVTGPPGPGLLASSVFAYRGSEEPVMGLFAVEREVLMAAHAGSDHAAEHEQHGTGEATLEQLRADLIRLSSLSDTDAPFPAFLDMRQVRDRICRLLDRRQRPRDQADLYFLAGCLNGLMGVTANRLGYPAAAEELIRAGWAYANVIDHNALRGMLRAEHAYVMYWRGWYSKGCDLAADGLRYTSQGPVGANLHLEHARAAARLGDVDTARQAVGLAHDARESDYRDDLAEIGGDVFALSRATTYSMAGGALAEIGDGREAAGDLEQAISLYDEGPGSGEQPGFTGKALAGTDLAVVKLRSGALDAAERALGPVLALPPGQRVSTLTARLARVRNELAAPIFRNSLQARDLGGQIEEFGRGAMTAGLHPLSAMS